jgi:hypothetical protein
MKPLQPHELTRVRTVYDEIMYIPAVIVEKISAHPARLIPCYHSDGRPKMDRRPGGSAADWMQVYLHPENICSHQRENWKTWEDMDGHKWPYCPTCSPAHNQDADRGQLWEAKLATEPAPAPTGSPRKEGKRRNGRKPVSPLQTAFL